MSLWADLKHNSCSNLVDPRPSHHLITVVTTREITPNNWRGGGGGRHGYSFVKGREGETGYSWRDREYMGRAMVMILMMTVMLINFKG